MALQLRPLSHSLGAEICDIDVTRNFSEPEFAQIRQALLDYERAAVTEWPLAANGHADPAPRPYRGHDFRRTVGLFPAKNVAPPRAGGAVFFTENGTLGTGAPVAAYPVFSLGPLYAVGRAATAKTPAALHLSLCLSKIRPPRRR